MGVWVYGSMGVWGAGCIGVWAYRCICVWVYGCGVRNGAGCNSVQVHYTPRIQEDQKGSCVCVYRTTGAVHGGVWVETKYGCMCVWMYGCIGVWVYRCMGV